AGPGLAADGIVRDATVVARAVTLRDHAFELRERQVHDPPIPWVHRLERDDLALIDGLLPKASGHRRQRIVAPRPVPFGVHEDVTTVEAWPIDHPVGQKLNCL